MVKETKDKPQEGIWRMFKGLTKGLRLGDMAKLAIHILILKPIMWISAAVFELASYYYNGGCTDCHKRQSILNKWNPDIFNMLWGLSDKKEDKKE